MAAFSCNICGRGFDLGNCNCDSIPDEEPTVNTSTDKKLPETEALAEAFIRLLRAQLGDETYAKVVALNAAELNPDVCASGDFCDSNMVMDAAFHEFGIDPCEYGRVDEDDGMPQEVCDLWNAAWDRGKELMQLGK